MNILTSSAMSGHRRWEPMGGAGVVAGLALEVDGARLKKKKA